MAPLTPELRHDLDKAISSSGTGARGLAESAARATLARLGVADAEAPAALTAELRGLRTALRERAKALGGGVRTLGLPLLVEEIAYEQWHRMLFARFLAENDLLLHPEGAPVSIAVVRELATEEGERDPWVLAARYAAAMLPGIFRADDPANRVAFAPEDRSRLEAVLELLPAEVFTADDALGWVYQFWQSERKDEVNKRGDKIGRADLPPVTQLFTEHYMVRFLLENSLGAWWASRHPDSPLRREWEYLRFRDDETPAAGTFEGWPERVAEVTVMDPCCGSGHFLTAAADMLRRMRSEEEGLTPAQAAAAVIHDNLFGLELDARCLQLAAFNLALDAWKAGGYQPLPIPNLACSGIAIKGQRADWHRLAGGDSNMADALDRLYNLFQDAPELGSLIDPRGAAGDGLWAVDPDELLAKLDDALRREAAIDPAAAVFGAAAAGTAKAAQLLARRYWLVTTNPPFLGRRHQSDRLIQFADSNAFDARHDLSTMMLGRGIGLVEPAAAVAFVTPQAWTTLSSSRDFRASLLARLGLAAVARLGPGAFQEVSGEVVKVCLVIGVSARESTAFYGLECSGSMGDDAKAACLRRAPGVLVDLQTIHSDPDHRVVLAANTHADKLGLRAVAYKGLTTGDDPRFRRSFWEHPKLPSGAEWFQTGPDHEAFVGGCSGILLSAQLTGDPPNGYRPMSDAPLRSPGVALGHVGALRAALYRGTRFDQSVAAIVPNDATLVGAIFSYAISGEFEKNLRELDSSIKVTEGTLTKVPFDLDRWQKVTAEQFPDGLPEPYTDDPTQWLFRGTVPDSDVPLQVAVARLLGYSWPDQEPDALDELADADGLVPLVSVGGERPAAERLWALLARAYGDGWSLALLDRLLVKADSPGATLEAWLRDDFFAQHAKLFVQRPFVWHVSDGRKDGFHVLCNYHRLDRAALEKLTYTLLGDWIERQKAAGDEPGAQARLSAAVALQEKLAAILVGEAPLDIYVRWKPLAEQPLGWEPDLDDGARLNIRPFVTANVLRAKVNVKWGTDRGKNHDGSERVNDLHPTLAEKRAARAVRGGG